MSGKRSRPIWADRSASAAMPVSTEARSRCISAARAAGLPSPIQAVYMDVHDLDGLRASCARGRELGFFGRSAVHPAQVDVINEVYTPSDDEVRDARELIAALDAAHDSGTGAFLLPDGRFVDVAVSEQARLTVKLADSLAG
jgi:citrate lyase subunit beta / citryl-CoA lyase